MPETNLDPRALTAPPLLRASVARWVPGALAVALWAGACTDAGGTNDQAVGSSGADPQAEPASGSGSGQGSDEPDTDFPVIPNLPATPTFSVSTVPPSGDVNPYGVAFVPDGFPTAGLLRPGDIVVSNFNNSNNVQGTGSSIVTVHADGTQSLFFQGPPGLGLSTALGVLQRGLVIVGNVPSTNGSGMCVEDNGVQTGVGQGMLTILDQFGRVVGTIACPTLLDGPWDLTVLDRGDTAAVFVSNVLTGTVTRLDLAIQTHGQSAQAILRHKTQIASGYVHRCDPAAFVVGPTGLALDEARDLLYVASTGDNKIFAIPDATTRDSDARKGEVFIDDPVHLHGPLGLALAPNGNLLSSQGDAVNFDPNHPSAIVEFDPTGAFVAQFSIDPSPGAAFGLAIRAFQDGFIFAAVDDATNVLDVWVVP